MHLLRKIAATGHLHELLSSDEVTQAEAYEAKGWVVLRRTPMSKGRETYGQQAVYAQITDAGRKAIELVP